MTLRFWFRNSERYEQGPYTMVGILASSWDEATAKACGPTSLPLAQHLLCIPPEYYYLSCNVLSLQALPDEDDGAEVVVRS